MSGYSQFIYGKFYAWNSGYRLVACTPNLEQYQEQLRNIAEKEFRFWGGIPPEGNKKAVGIFQIKNQIGTFSPQDYLVILQTEEALKASGGAPYTQQRYIFVPKKDIVNEPSLLAGLWKMTIPIFSDIFEANLEYFKAELLEAPKTRDLKDEKIKEIVNCFEDKKDGEQPLILSALSALLKKQKLVLTIDEQTIIPQKFVENLLLILPVSCSNLLAVVMGNIEETVCVWANLIIKTNGFPNLQKLPKDMIWLNRKNKKILPQISRDILQHPYVRDFLIPIANNPDSIRQMLQHLQKLTDDEFTLDNLSQSNTLAHIIPGLTPSEKQIEYWCKYIPTIPIETVINRNIDQESLFCLWQALEKLYKNNTQHEQLMLLVIQKLDTNKVSKIIRDRLIQDLNLAENLASKLFDVLNVEDTSISIALKQLCVNIVKEKSKFGELDKAWELAVVFANRQNIYSSYNEQFTILDAVLFGENIPQEFILSWFSSLGYLLVNVEPKIISDSNFCKKHLSKYFPKVKELLQSLLNNGRENIVYLLHIADEMNMIPKSADKMFFTFLNNYPGITYEESLSFLRLLIKKSIDRQQIIRLNTDVYSETFAWFKNLEENLKNTLTQLEQNSPDWGIWCNVASIFCKSGSERVKYLDKEIHISAYFPVEILKEWILIIESNVKEKESFKDSDTYLNLEQETINNFIAREQIHIITLTNYLAQDRAFQLISGILLKSVCQLWLNNKNMTPAESNLWNILVTTDNKFFRSDDYLQLIHVSWYLEKETVIPLNKIALSDEDKRAAYIYVSKIIKDCKDLKQGQKLIHDCYGLKLNNSYIQMLVVDLIVAVSANDDEIIKLLTQAETTWGLDGREQKKIIEKIANIRKNNPLLEYYVKINTIGCIPC